ncbi:probable cytochrome P450 9f2 [Uranotaenia lowii]|uniref:probable cytochrome P450 9f2 n=1 Tax=Uranotaenia lowii TaxID=190385 RepID=UPI00247B037E|nr:probable cytochrome P450 9f2 [Uranotaenia lowii]
MDWITWSALVALIGLIYYFFAKKYEYFDSKPIPLVRPTFLLGSTAPILFRRRNVLTHVNEIYYTYPDAKMIGFFDLVNPIYMLRDPETIKQIAIKDFDFFSDHTPMLSPSEVDEDTETLFGNSLFALRGQKWRDMRATLSPAFTGRKMRHMFELVGECGKSMASFFRAELEKGEDLELEMKDVFSRYGNDVIASVAFGISVDSLRDKENEFYVKGKDMLKFNMLKMLWKVIIMRSMPSLARKLKLDFTDAVFIKYFKGTIEDNMKQRKTHNIVRNDMIQMLMDVQRGALSHQQEEKDGKDAGFATVEESAVGKATHSRTWSNNELIAQCFLFFLAGFETTSGGLSFLLYELCVNPEIQQRLHEEILQTSDSLNGQPLTYETLQKMEYMDMVVSESLRKWPPMPFTDRYCHRDYLFEGVAEKPFIMEKQSTAWIPIIAIHRDAKYYPDPDKFDPERFSKENRSRILAGAYLPFGVGPRNCIGSRLALMEVKSAVYHLVKEFEFVPSSKTEIPLELSRKNTFGLQTQNGVWLKMKSRNVIG